MHRSAVRRLVKPIQQDQEMTLQPLEERVREDLTFDKRPTFRVRALRKAPLSMTRVIYGITGPAVEVHAGGGENALVATLPLTNVSACEQWIDGRHIIVAPMKRYDTAFIDLNSKYITNAPPSDLLLFHMPREAFDTIADEHGVRRIETFRVQPTKPLDDPVIRGLAPLLEAALERPEQTNCLFTDHIGDSDARARRPGSLRNGNGAASAARRPRAVAGAACQGVSYGATQR
jgi:hypothetical protein